MLVVSAGVGMVAQGVMLGLADARGRKLHLALSGAERPPPFGFESVVLRMRAAHERARLLEGETCLVLLPAYDRAIVDEQVAIVAAARDVGVRSIALVTLAGADAASPVELLRHGGQLLRAVEASGVPRVTLHCAPFAQNLGLFTERDGAGFAVVGPFRGAAFPWIDARDIGEIVAAMSWTGIGPSLDLMVSGDETVDFASISAVLSRETGRPVRFVDVLMPAARGRLEACGLSATRIRLITEYWDHLVNGATRPAPSLRARTLLGRPLRGVGPFLQEMARELRPAA